MAHSRRSPVAVAVASGELDMESIDNGVNGISSHFNHQKYQLNPIIDVGHHPVGMEIRLGPRAGSRVSRRPISIAI